MTKVKYDYENQVWIVNGIYQNCGHLESMNCNCFGRLHKGKEVNNINRR